MDDSIVLADLISGLLSWSTPEELFGYIREHREDLVNHAGPICGELAARLRHGERAFPLTQGSVVLASSLVVLGQRGPARDLLLTLLPALPAIGDRADVFGLLAEAAQGMGEEGRETELGSVIGVMLDLSRALPDGELERAYGLSLAAWALARFRPGEDVTPLVDEALDLLNDTPVTDESRAVVAVGLLNCGRILCMHLEQPATALHPLERGTSLLQEAEEANEVLKERLADGLGTWGSALQMLERHDEAVSLLAQSVAVTRSLEPSEGTTLRMRTSLELLGASFGELSRETEMLRAFELARTYGSEALDNLLASKPEPWHLYLRLHVATGERIYLSRALHASRTRDPDVFELLLAYQRGDILTVMQRTQDVHARLLAHNRIAEAYSVMLCVPSLTVSQSTTADERPGNEFGKVYEVISTAAEEGVTLSRRLNDRLCLVRFLFVRASTALTRQQFSLGEGRDATLTDLRAVLDLLAELAAWDPEFEDEYVSALGNVAAVEEPHRIADRIADVFRRESVLLDGTFNRAMDLARLFTNVAIADALHGDGDQAVGLLERARQIIGEIVPEDDHQAYDRDAAALQILTNLAAASFNTPHSWKTLRLLEEALTLYSRLGTDIRLYRPTTGIALLTLKGTLLRELNLLEESYEALQEAVSLADGYMVVLPSHDDQLQLLGQIPDCFGSMVETCFRFMRRAPTEAAREQWVHRAWEYAERSRAQLTRAFNNETLRDHPVGGADTERLGLVEEYRQVADELRGLESGITADADIVAQRRHALRSRLRRIQSLLAEVDPGVGPGRSLATASLDDVHAALAMLPDGAVLLEMVQTGWGLAVFRLDGRSLRVVSVGLDWEEVARRTAEIDADDIARAGASPWLRPALIERLDASLSWLADCLTPILGSDVLPSASCERDRVPHLIFAASGDLQLWPLWALPLPGTGVRLSDRYACATVPSASALADLASSERPPGPYIGLAPAPTPEFTSVRTLYEASVLGGTALVGAEATFEALCAVRGGIVSLSTHADLVVNAPELSYVWMARPDGELYRVGVVEFLVGLHQLRGSLMPLWACAIHSARSGAGDNWIGLSRAFLRGARSLVLGLWYLDDATTLAVCVAFWDGITGGLTVAQALRSAVLSTRELDTEGLRMVGERVAAMLPVSRRSQFQDDWNDLAVTRGDFGDLVDWAPYLVVGWPGKA